MMSMVIPLGLYIHIPWCVRKCPYCDFNSHRAEGSMEERLYVEAILKDLDEDLPCVEGRTIETIFFGGGTPSLMSGEAISSILEGVRARISVADEAEVTLEANPGTAEQEKFMAFRAAGVNRLSIGVQSFHSEHLLRLGRIHDEKEAIEAMRMAQMAGFEAINLDLMFGLPQQTLDEAMRDVMTAITLSPTHLSYYQLTLEPNTVFHKYPPKLPGDERIWMIQEKAQALLAEAGYGQYEVSAYAQEGLTCCHNRNIWEFGDYLGIGAGAHGKITHKVTGTITRTAKVRHPTHYLRGVLQNESRGSRERVDSKHLPFEFMMNALRLRDGFKASLFEQRTGLYLECLDSVISDLVSEGLIDDHSGRIRCTPRGFNFLDNVLQRFLL